MKYLCLLYQDNTLPQRMPQEEVSRLQADWTTFLKEEKKNGHLVDQNGLQPGHTATTISVRNGKVMTTDGPFVETKEQLGGYVVIEARDLNEAIQVAAKIPSARYGSIEVRPLYMFQPQS